MSLICKLARTFVSTRISLAALLNQTRLISHLPPAKFNAPSSLVPALSSVRFYSAKKNKGGLFSYIIVLYFVVVVD